ncbi:hypothetical protein F511_35955 [Dorcoceras hygrometricum]|uniref:Uncharacterized protein n=1 Tax=Dorcoceras hygrometricum TaxID=472368 RepID=A0A2Z7D702_9LAMI|nr:hypothetical protein F511_35955 [Dorcoceras hygrometricum]
MTQIVSLGIADSACKNQLVMVSVQYGPFSSNIPIESTTIGKSRVARDSIAMHTSWRSNSDIACATRDTVSRGLQLFATPKIHFWTYPSDMVKYLATSFHDPLGITDSACKNQLVMVSVQYGPFSSNIPIESTTIGKSRVARDSIVMHTSWRSKSDIACATSEPYPVVNPLLCTEPYLLRFPALDVSAWSKAGRVEFLFSRSFFRYRFWSRWLAEIRSELVQNRRELKKRIVADQKQLVHNKHELKKQTVADHKQSRPDQMRAEELYCSISGASCSSSEQAGSEASRKQPGCNKLSAIEKDVQAGIVWDVQTGPSDDIQADPT